MASPVRALVVVTTAGSAEQADELAEAILARRHAGCVNIVPGVRSIYRWRGEVHRDGEWLLIIKTLEGEYDSLVATIHELHSYELPEILAFAADRGAADYLEWLSGSVGSDARSSDEPASGPTLPGED